MQDIPGETGYIIWKVTSLSARISKWWQQGTEPNGALPGMHFGQQCRPHTQQTQLGGKEWMDSRTSPPHSQREGYMDQEWYTRLSYMTLSTATLVSQFLETQLKIKCEIKKKICL